MPLVELPGFTEQVQHSQWAGERLPVLFDGQRACRFCSVGYLVSLDPFAQPALFYHGGYGAVERKTVDVCLACGRVSVMRLETVNPRRL